MLRFECRSLEHGSLDASITDGKSSADVSASYICDAPGDLARAVISLLSWMDHAVVSWLEEPGEYRWLLKRTGELVDIRILWFDSEHPRQPDERGRLVFSTTARLVDLAGQVTSQLTLLLNRYGEDGYWEHWHSPFPRQEHETLLRLRRERRQRRAQ